jgi:hypothetical protein
MKMTQSPVVWGALFAIVLFGSQAYGQLDVSAGHVVVNQGATSADIPIHSSGSGSVTDMLLVVQVGDGGTVTGNPPVPKINAVSLSGSVWSPESNYNTFSGFGPPDAPPDEIIDFNVEALGGVSAVPGSGLLATITLDLTGFSIAGNTWDIHLVDDFGTSTLLLEDTTEVTGTLTSGSLTVVIPEPASVALLGGVMLLALRRGRRA